jgi:hypothetical protein
MESLEKVVLLLGDCMTATSQLQCQMQYVKTAELVLHGVTVLILIVWILNFNVMPYISRELYWHEEIIYLFLIGTVQRRGFHLFIFT